MLLILAAILMCYEAWTWGMRLPIFPIRDVQIMTPLKSVSPTDIEAVIRGKVRGNFFSVPIDEIRAHLEKQPWVRKVEVRRQWPGRLALQFEEHKAVAYWDEVDSGQLVNSFGEVFNGQTDEDLPVLSGPEGASGQLLKQYSELQQMLKPLGRTIDVMTLSSRLAWSLLIDGGMQIELGREQPKISIAGRLARLIERYPKLKGPVEELPVRVDLRYPNGFALRMKRETAVQSSVTKNSGTAVRVESKGEVRLKRPGSSSYGR